MPKHLLLPLLLVSHLVTAQTSKIDSLEKLVATEKKEDTLLLNRLAFLSNAYVYYDFGKGLETAEKGFGIARKIKDSSTSLARLYLAKGLNQWASGKPDIARTSLQQAITIATLNKDNLLRLQATKDFAAVLMDAGKTDSAKVLFIKTLNEAQQLGHLQLVLQASGNLGIVSTMQSDYVQALKWFLQTEKLMNETGIQSNRLNMLVNIGLTYLQMWQNDKAQSYFLQGLELAKKSGHLMAQSVCLTHLSAIATNKRDYAQAIRYAETAQHLFKESKNRSTPSIFLFTGTAYLESGNYPKAKVNLDSAVAAYRQAPADVDLSLALTYLGRFYTEAPDSLLAKEKLSRTAALIKAEALLKESIALADSSKNTERQIKASNALAAVLEKKGQYKEAFRHLERAAILSESLFNDEKRLQAGYMEAEFENEKKTAVLQASHTAELKRQKTVRNSLMGGAGLLLLTGGVLFWSYKRRRDAEELAQTTDTQMKVLRLQMNPHFIFNSLSSISDYIRRNDTDEADEYLTSFAKVMRLTLENSEQKEVPLADDLEALHLYMQLEAKRLNNKFTYSIDVADDVDQENTLVPPMLLQPFAENSIWHGISKKQGNGHITITIHKQNNMLHCSVEDDGIGRANTIQPGIPGEKKSLGMRITQSRINMLNKLKNTNATVHLTDKEKGLKAEIILPLETAF